MVGPRHDFALVTHAASGLRERRVHDHHSRAHVLGEQVVELLGVLGEHAVHAEGVEVVSAALGDLVGDHLFGIRVHGEHRKGTVPGRRL